MVSQNQIIVTAAQMGQIETQIFAGGMPIPALMEKAALLVAKRVQQFYPMGKYSKVGVLVGPGHNGGDGLVVARELYLAGYQVCLYSPFNQAKDLTRQHWQYAQELLKIPIVAELADLENTDLLIDAWFGFGLTRSITGELAKQIEIINQWSQPVVSIDLPSGIHTDTGEVLGTAIQATETFCLGLWKRAFFQDQALPYLGKTTLIDFGIPSQLIPQVLGDTPLVWQMDAATAKEYLSLPRQVLTHKYQQGHLLLICGSTSYVGAAILSGLGARATGVGMLSIAVPESLKSLVLNYLPEAIVIGCRETSSGAISSVPVQLAKYQAIACGPGLTTEADAVVKSLLGVDCPLILDADALNIIAQTELINAISQRQFPTIMTPHLGEFKRLFPSIKHPERDRITAVKQGAELSKSIVLLKGARTAIAIPSGEVWVLGESTPALARGGSGDLLTGLLGGLVAQNPLDTNLEKVVATGACWHSQGAILAAAVHTELGVDPLTLAGYLPKFLIN